jgi:hypothetical protein
MRTNYIKTASAVHEGNELWEVRAGCRHNIIYLDDLNKTHKKYAVSKDGEWYKYPSLTRIVTEMDMGLWVGAMGTGEVWEIKDDGTDSHFSERVGRLEKQKVQQLDLHTFNYKTAKAELWCPKSDGKEINLSNLTKTHKLLATNDGNGFYGTISGEYIRHVAEGTVWVNGYNDCSFQLTENAESKSLGHASKARNEKSGYLEERLGDNTVAREKKIDEFIRETKAEKDSKVTSPATPPIPEFNLIISHAQKMNART